MGKGSSLGTSSTNQLAEKLLELYRTSHGNQSIMRRSGSTSPIASTAAAKPAPVAGTPAASVTPGSTGMPERPLTPKGSGSGKPKYGQPGSNDWLYDKEKRLEFHRKHQLPANSSTNQNGG